MSAATRSLHDAIDAHARRTGIPYLHPDEPTVQLDLLGSAQVIEWQEGKAAFLFASEGCWSELPHLYARYGTTATAQLIAKLKTLEHASGRAGLRFGHAGDGARLRRADGARRPRRADAAGLQQDAQLSRVDGRARRRLGHDRRRRRHGGAGGGDPPGDAIRVRRDVHQPAGARAGLRRAARRHRPRARDRAGAAARARHHHRHAVGVQRRRRSTKASTSSSPAAPRRSAATIATCGATSPPTTRSSPTR